MRFAVLMLVLVVGLVACDTDPSAAKPNDPPDTTNNGPNNDAPDVGTDPDVGPEDPDVGSEEPDTSPGPTARHTTTSLSAGGGRGSSNNYKARLIVGAPTPVGDAKGGASGVVLGAGAAQHGQ